MPLKPTLWMRLMEANPLVKGGYLLLLIAAILILVAIVRSGEPRGPSRALFLVAVVAAVAGYLMVDFGYVSLNLRMRDSEGFREACQQLLREQPGRAEGESYLIPNEHFPEALGRLGPQYIEVRRPGCILVVLPWIAGSVWSYVYIPAGATAPLGIKLRATIHREIYAARIDD
jgi:hypothetical protein